MKRRKKAETMKKCLKSLKECAKIRDKFLKGYERDCPLELDRNEVSPTESAS